MTRLDNIRDLLGGAGTERVYGPDGWMGVCGGRAHDCRTRAGAWLWCLRTAWSVSRDDFYRIRLHRRGIGRG